MKVLSAGPTPQHVAIIMDGNRRYARQNNLTSDIDKHIAAHARLQDCMALWLGQTDIPCLSVYAFSILNFGRDEKDIACLMNLIENKLDELFHTAEVHEYQVRLEVHGRKEMLPLSLQHCIQRAEVETRHYTQRVMRFYLPYTSSDEMTRSVESCVHDCATHWQQTQTCCKITPQDIERHLMAPNRANDPKRTSRAVEILIRTSNTKRLSDFLMWQSCRDTQIQFLTRLWPEMNFWDVLTVLLDYQRVKWNMER